MRLSSMAHKTILLVEDDPDDQELIRSVFGAHNIEAKLEVVSDAVEALRYLSIQAAAFPGARHPWPALILLDLKMPKMSGLETLRLIRADPRARYVPVVVFTSSNHDQDILDSYQLGVNSYVRKAIDFAEFAESLVSVARYWLEINEPPPLEAVPEPSSA